MFWRLAGPLLLYWCIQFAAQVVAEMVLIIPYAGEIVSAASWKDTMTDADLQQAMVQMTVSAAEIFQRYYVQIFAVTALCTIPLTAFLFRRDRKRERELALPQNRMAPVWKYVWILILGIVVCIGVSCLSVMTDLAFTSKGYQETSEVLYSAGFFVQIVCLGIISPISEELMFRGVLFKRIRERCSFMQSALGASVLFAVIHGNMVQILYAFGLGMLLAYVYEKYGSFKAPVFLHIAANITSLICTETGVFDWIVLSPERMAVSVILCAFLGAVMFVLIQRIEEKPDVPEEQTGENITPDMFR